jgi:hypothetical protein
MTTPIFQLYQTKYERVRVGRDYDGGYIVCNIPNYDFYIGGGICNDISFDKDLLDRYPSIKGIGFDGSIDELPMGGHPRLGFIKKFIGKENTDTVTTLKEYMSPYSNICMKIDIEGGEVDMFEALDESDITKIAQLVIEFHISTETKIPSRMNNTHVLVHFHGNNYGGVDSRGMPDVFECTYLRKDIAGDCTLYTGNIPISSLDQPNNPYNSDITVTNDVFQSIF